MGKNKHKGNKGNAGAQVVAPTNVQPQANGTVKVVPGVLQVHKPNAPLRGARQAWHALLVKYDGKPVAEFLQAAAENPPSVPKSGVVEKPQGWLRWFVRNGIASVAAPTEA